MEKKFKASPEVQLVSLAELTVGKERKPADILIAELAASINQYGVLHPIVIREDGSIIDGVLRVWAARLAGRTTIPVFVRSL